MVGSGPGRDGNRNLECISFPNATSRPLPDLSLCFHRLPSRLTASCSRPDGFPSRRSVYSRFFPSHRPPSCSHPIPTFAHNVSHPATHSSGGCSHPIYHGLYIPLIIYMTMNATRLYQFGLLFNFGCKTAAAAIVYYRYVEEIVRLIF